MKQSFKGLSVVGPGDPFDFWHSVTCETYSSTECTSPGDTSFLAEVSMLKLDALVVSKLLVATGSGAPTTVVRTQDNIRKDNRDDYLLWLTISGNAWLEQKGRASMMQPGDILLQDQSKPFRLKFGAYHRAISVTIPRPLLESRLHNAGEMVARNVEGQRGIGRLVTTMVGEMSHLHDDLEDHSIRRLAHSTLDIIATLFDASVTNNSPNIRLQKLARVKKYIIANMQDPKLDIAMIASSQNITPRTLNRLFTIENTTPIRWLWQQRLHASFTAIQEKRVMQVTDAALRFGFTDVSHFSRAFKKVYGYCPRTLLAGQ